jgi:hypothetical protein
LHRADHFTQFSWSLVRTITVEGPLRISAQATTRTAAGETWSEKVFRNVTVRLDKTDPTLDIDPLPNNGRLEGPDREFPVPLKGSAADVPAGVSKVEARVDAGPYIFSAVAQTPDWGRWYFDTLKVPLGPHTITVRAVDRFGRFSPEKSVQVTAVDTISPTVTISFPKPTDKVEAKFIMSGGASDTQSGVARVEWQVGTGGVNQAKEDPAGSGWRTWSAPVEIPTAGAHIISVWCFDKSGNRSATTQVTVSAEAPPPTDWDPSSPVSYYRELHDFAKSKVRDVNGLLVTNFEAVFYQPFDRLASVSPASALLLRLAVETLRRYLTANPPAAAQATALAAAEAAYRQAAYETILSRIGTSFQEIRLVRVADDVPRKALADRLGIDLGPRPDDLDRLALNQVSEAGLEKLFGLRDTNRDPLQPTPTADLLTWQRLRLRRIWKEQDNAPTAPLIVDPDVIGPGDLVQREGNPAAALLQSRRAQVDAWLTNLAKPGPGGETAAQRFKRLVESVLAPTTLAKLLEWDEARKAGKRIDAELVPTKLSLEAFMHVMRLHNLAKDPNTAPIEAEWADLYAILVQVQKLKAFDQWRKDEVNLRLDPDFFRLAETAAPPLRRWLASATARRDWQDTLRGRIDQDAAVAAALEAAVAETEAATLPQLRDALVTAAGKGLTNVDIANWLTDRLLLDVAVNDGGILRATRLAQASETVQSLLFSIRTGRFPSPQDSGPLGAHPAWNWKLVEVPSFFDPQWAWMRSFATWQSASTAYNYPENLLLPSLRQDATFAFGELLGAVQGRSGFTPNDARTVADDYLVAARKLSDCPAELKTDWIPVFQLTDQLDARTPPGLDQWAAESRERLNTYKISPAQRRFIEEAYFFVPLQIALQLQQAGQYDAALAWFRLVYAYDLRYDFPIDNRSPGKRKVYHGLVLEEGRPPYIKRGGQWLLDLTPHSLAGKRGNAYTRFVLLSLAQCFLDYADDEFAAETVESVARARALYLDALDLLDSPELRPAPAPDPNPPLPNPLPRTLRQHAELNLMKIRSGRNITGFRREIDPATSEGGTVQPTQYRYSTLIERAKQLVALAQQVEASYLSALEKRDAEAYNLLRARHDLGLSGATVGLQQLRLQEATAGVRVTKAQRQRAQIQVDYYQDLLSEPISALEQASLAESQAVAGLQLSSAVASFYASQLPASIGVSTSISMPPSVSASYAISPQGSTLAVAGGMSSLAAARGTTASILGTKASYERREQEWQSQLSLTQQDVFIADQQVAAAGDHAQVVAIEGVIAGLQAKQAEETVTFLATKFTNERLYEVMIRILGRVYAYFLQQAASMARLAQSQLAFERQEATSSFIQADYWRTPVAGGTGSDSNGTDLRGLTGSARLLQDLYRLDGYAFETDKRKLQLTKTFSLARLAPFEFQRFRQTGVLPFQTPIELFDWDFPGHYLRLIKRVRMSVVALVPAVHGIRATLLNNGVSRVTVGDDAFRTVVVRRDPELIALSSAKDATGVFELDARPDMLGPFEGSGVAAMWELQMAKAANPIDYRTIADVLFTVEYTALDSFDYRQQVIRRLDRTMSGDRIFSFRQEMPDAWFSLCNPDPGTPDGPVTVSFHTLREDFASNLEALKIKQVIFALVRPASAKFEIAVGPSFTFLNEDGSSGTVRGTKAVSINGHISTRTSAYEQWSTLVNKPPDGNWEMTIDKGASGDPPLHSHFSNGDVEDVLFAISYEGRTPDRPA